MGEAPLRRALFSRELPGLCHRAFGIDGTNGDPGDRDEQAALGLEVDVSTVLTLAAAPGPAAPSAPRAPGPTVHALAVGADDDWEQLVALQEAADALPGLAGHRLCRTPPRRANCFVSHTRDDTTRTI